MHNANLFFFFGLCGKKHLKGTFGTHKKKTIHDGKQKKGKKEKIRNCT